VDSYLAAGERAGDVRVQSWSKRKRRQNSTHL
jgi:hypothetical protein